MKQIIAFLVCFFYSTLALQAETLAHYTFDTDYSVSIGGSSWAGTAEFENGTSSASGITTTEGEYKFGGGAMNFSTDEDRLNIGSHEFAAGTDYSFSFWAKRSATTDGGAFGIVIGENDTLDDFVGVTDSLIRFRGESDTTEKTTDATIAPGTDWHHYVISVSSANTLSFYYDGALHASTGVQDTGFRFDSIGSAYLDENFGGGGNDAHNFDGQIDELYIYNNAVTETDAALLYNSNIPEPTVMALLSLCTIGIVGLRKFFLI